MLVNKMRLISLKKCYYPTYQFLIDWDGNLYLCPQDWQRRMPMGNILQEKILDIWKGKILSKYEKIYF